jgi:hypothetical protein
MLHIRLTPWLAALAALSMACGDDGLAGTEAALDAEADDAAPGDDGDAAPGDDGDAAPSDGEDPPEADECATFSCGDHGFCMPSEGAVHCACDAGYAGDHCETCAPGFVVGGSPARCAAVLSATRPEPAGEHCAHGGVAADSGADLDADGALDPAEVTATEYVCNAGPPGAGCEEDSCGGHGACAETDRGATCLCDSAYDGRHCELCADGFITSRDGACVRPQRLAIEELEPRGARCAHGGIAVSRGLDVDDDGQLSATEIERIDYVCNTAEIRTGNVTVDSQARLDDLTGVTEIIGNLTVSAPYITSLEPLAKLGRVSGDLVIQNNPRLESLAGLDVLHQIGGSLVVGNNAKLRTIGVFGELVRVTGNLDFSNNPELESIDLGALETVGNGLLVRQVPALASLTGGRLLSVVGPLAIEGAAGLTDISGLRALDAVGGALSIAGTGLAELSALDALRETGDLTVSGNAELRGALSLPKLRATRGNLSIFSNALLSSVGPFPVLTHVDGALSISDNASLQGIDGFPALALTSHVGVHGNPLLASIVGFAALTRVDPVNAPFCDRWSTACPSWEWSLSLENLPTLARVEAFERLATTHGLVRLVQLPALQTLSAFGSLTYARTITIDSSGLASLALPALASAEEINLYANPELTTLAVESLTSLHKLRIVDNDELTSAGTWAALTTLGELAVTDNELLPELPTMPQLEELGYGLQVYNNASLRGTTGLTALETIYNAWDAGYTFRMPSPEEAPVFARANVLVDGNASLVGLGFLSALVSAPALAVAHNPALETAILPALGSASAITIVENERLAAFEAPAASSLYQLHVETHPSLVRVSAGGGVEYLTLRDAPLLRELSSGLFSSSGGNIELSRLPALTALPAAGAPFSTNYFQIYHTGLVSLSGLESMSYSGSLNVTTNRSLTSLSGLSATFRGQTLTIWDNDQLVDLRGLEGVTELYSLDITENDGLTSLTGFQGRMSYLSVYDNRALPTCEAFAFAERVGVWSPSINGNDDAGVCE